MLAQECKLGKFKKCKCNRLGTKLVQARFGSTLDLSVKFSCQLEHFGLVFWQNTRFWIPIPLHFMDNFNTYQTLKEHVRFTFASGGGGAYLASGSWLKLPTISIQGWPRFNGSCCCSMGPHGVHH